jgi:predicted peptidase
LTTPFLEIDIFQPIYLEKADRAVVQLGRFFYAACGRMPDSKVEHDVFEEKNMPVFEYDREGNFYLCKPLDYDENHSRKDGYPLVVYLHGWNGAGEPRGLSRLGYNEPMDFKKTYPCFVYIAQTSSSWNNNILIDQIEKLKNSYRIDKNRIYLIGYSMGGSGSYSLANAYYDFNGHLFAGIIRLAGQSQTTVREAIAKNTSIWLHIGLKDDEKRINVTREAYENLKKYHTHAFEKSDCIDIDDHPGTTLTLTKDSIEIVKKSEYDNEGHGISHFPFQDAYLLDWLFSQSLQKKNKS